MKIARRNSSVRNIYLLRDPPSIPPSSPLRICWPIWLPTVRAACLAIVSTIPCRRFVSHNNSLSIPPDWPRPSVPPDQSARPAAGVYRWLYQRLPAPSGKRFCLYRLHLRSDHDSYRIWRANEPAVHLFQLIFYPSNPLLKTEIFKSAKMSNQSILVRIRVYRSNTFSFFSHPIDCCSTFRLGPIKNVVGSPVTL